MPRMPLIIAACAGMTIATPAFAEDELPFDLQKELEKMSPQERQHFYETRRKIQNDMKTMSKEDREAFRAQINSERETRENIHYIEQEKVKEPAADGSDWDEMDWKAKREFILNQK
tara:strand:+ start:227 stop:574 length:348 start_codon:yes stop_codon:yes gene_type:complete